MRPEIIMRANRKGFMLDGRLVPRRPFVICDGCEKMVRVLLLVEDEKGTDNYCEQCANHFVQERWPHMRMENTVNEKGEPVAVFAEAWLDVPDSHPRFQQEE